MIINPTLLSISLMNLIVMSVGGYFLILKTKHQNLKMSKLLSIEQEYRKFLENAPNKIIRYDINGKRVYVSDNSQYYTDKKAEALLGKTPSEYPGGDSAIEYERSIRNVFKTKRNTTAYMQWQTENGKAKIVKVELIPEFDRHGEVLSVLSVGQDITAIIETQYSIQQLGHFDQLTGLPSRPAVLDLIKNYIYSPASSFKNSFALMVLDIDDFKEVNDLLGYDAGDLVICELANRLKTILRKNDTLARLGGDEFAILVPHLKSKAALMLISEEIIALFRSPFYISGKELSITVSIGVALFPEDATDANQILNYADTAMYHAKKMGRNNTQFYMGEMTLHSLERKELDAALRKAIVRDELVLYYQPQVDLVNQILIGAEALLRWKHPVLGMLLPDKFIPLAEETGQIIEIGAWVLDIAFKAAVVWNKVVEIPFKVAVNLSTRQFIQNDLVGTVRNLLTETGCQPQWIKLEITESLLLDKSTDMLNKLRSLSEMGFDISIDDFGTGYSSLSYLTLYPIRQIKIDRSFICDIPTSLEKSELVKVIVQLSKVLNMDIVAEGVETECQAQYLSANGCYTAQGNLFGKPMPHGDFDSLVSASRKISPKLLRAGTK